MSDSFDEGSPDRPSENELRDDAAFAARRSGSGIGAAVAQAGYDGSERFWECIVSDGKDWRFIRVLGRGLGPTTDLPTEEIERGIERFAANLPDSYRLNALLNATPLHVDRSGTVTD